MILFLVLVWSVVLLSLIHFHLTTRDEIILSSFRSTLDTLATLLPSQSEQLANAILKAVGVISTQETLVSISRQVEEDLKNEESDPYTPPWEELDPLPKGKLEGKRGEWVG